MTFIPPPLTRERLAIIIRALEKRGGEMKARDLARLNRVEWWEIDQAEEIKAIVTEERKPRTGRPSKWVMLTQPRKSAPDGKNVSESYPTKLLPTRASLGQRISFREWDFAFWYVIGDFGPGTGVFGFKRRGWSSYLKAYPSCRSKAAARSSASRLLKKPRIKAAVAWQFARTDYTPGIERFSPQTATEIWDTLHRLGSERARWAPRHVQKRWVIASLQAKETPHGLD